MIYDIAIVGAGPAGATCALALANKGLKVAVSDKATFPRDKICGDALSGKVLSVLKYVSPSTLEKLHLFPPKTGSWGIRFVAPNTQILDIPFKNMRDTSSAYAPGYISKRIDFDDFLFRQIPPETAVFQNHPVASISKENHIFLLKSEKNTLRAKLLIGADGAHSIVTKTLGNIPVEKNHYSAGIRSYYRGVTGFHPENFIELHYITDLLPGYFWIFPLPDGYANVGLGMLSSDVKKYGVNLKDKLKEIVLHHPTISQRFSQAKPVGDIKGFGLPLGSKKRKISGEGFMLTGDAASLIDPFSGEGIGNAMLSGKIAAAQAVRCFESGDFSAHFMEEYDKAVYAKIWSELKLSHNMQKLVNFPSLFNFIARKANRNSAIQTMLTMMFDDLNIRKELSKPSFYWKLVTG
ncbi:MAG: NAD(P)/FAD-dependent oxidoreductase [Bacteroidia bacterium]|nr:NAD(P)/FAD-dependent oxidoreductase [Bacteroidia bacterium]